MKVSELIIKLKELKEIYGDVEVHMSDPDGRNIDPEVEYNSAFDRVELY